ALGRRCLGTRLRAPGSVWPLPPGRAPDGLCSRAECPGSSYRSDPRLPRRRGLRDRRSALPVLKPGACRMGNRLSRIVTRTGDDGTTALADGTRVRKDAARIEAMGEVDELNSLLGLLISTLAEGASSPVGAT